METEVRFKWITPKNPDRATRAGVEAQLQPPPLLLTGESEVRRHSWDGCVYRVTWIRSDHGPYNAVITFDCRYAVVDLN